MATAPNPQRTTRQTGTGVVLAASEVQVTLGGTTILPGTSLEVRQGEAHLLIGPNGAGKTTFANAVTGHVPVSGGTLELDGEALHGSIDRRTRSGVGRKVQVPRIFPRLTPAQHHLVASRRRRGHRGSCADR
ncbi:MAG: ATP-binding cassette domain-containing protein [Patulibacter sp.]